MSFNFDGATLINLILLIAILGFMWKLSQDVSGLSQRVARIEGILSVTHGTAAAAPMKPAQP